MIINSRNILALKDMTRNKYLRLWREKNKDRVYQYNKRYRKLHPEIVRTIWNKWWIKNLKKERLRKKIYMRDYNKREKTIREKRKWVFRNIEKLRNYRKKYYETHIEKRRNNRKACKYSRKILAGNLSTKTIQQVYEENIKKYGTLTCYLCLKHIKFGKDSLEHKIPICRGGTNEKKNLAIAHLNCNLKKHNKTFKEWKEVYHYAE